MVGVTSRNLQTQKPEPLTREEEYDLILRARAGEEAAKNCLIRKNRGLINIAVNCFNSQVDKRVLVAAGEMAVIISINKFDLSTGNKFSTYLVRAIWSHVRDCFCDETGIARHTLENLGKISKTSSKLYQELGRDPTLEEISDRSKLSKRQILNARETKTFSQPLSFNHRLDENYSEWLDFQIDDAADPWDTLEDAEILDTLDQLKDDGHLENRQVTILIAKHQGYNNREVGKELNLSRERARQLFKDAAEKIYAFAEGTLKPKSIKTTIPASTHHSIGPIGEGDQLNLELPAPAEVREPAMKRVDASRLGGRIGRAIKQIFKQTNKESHIHDHGELTNAQKHLLAFRRRSNHRTTNRPWYQSTPTDQRCCRLGQISDAWRGYLGFGQEKFQRPLAGAFQRIRGFGSKFSQWRGSNQFSTVNVFESLGTGQGSSLPNDPKDRISIETDSFLFGGINISITKYLALACLFMFGLFAAPKLSTQSNHLMASVSNANTNAQEYLIKLESLQTYIADMKSEIARDGPIQTQT